MKLFILIAFLNFSIFPLSIKNTYFIQFVRDQSTKICLKQYYQICNEHIDKIHVCFILEFYRTDRVKYLSFTSTMISFVQILENIWNYYYRKSTKIDIKSTYTMKNRNRILNDCEDCCNCCKLTNIAHIHKKPRKLEKKYRLLFIYKYQ